ncbi:MAG TPA: tetratricopeptide repeat protein, partial [Vicinamibacterales bacterium]|nr:tetratricopeptide repeat protein [Vicinamibacterales bacterium]
AAQSIDRLLDGFGPADKVGLAALPGPRMLVDFTRDRTAVVEAVKRIPAGAGAEGMSGAVDVAVGEAFAIDGGDSGVLGQVVSRECPPSDGGTRLMCSRSVEMEAHRVVMAERNRTSEFVSGLRALLRDLAAVDAPKLLLVFSEGFADPEAGREMAACGPLASAARATIFALRLDRTTFGLSSRRGPAFLLPSSDERIWSRTALEALAGAARGTALEVVGSAQQPFARLARELSGYYLVGVEAKPGDRDGKPHRIDVNVGRPDVTVRARREVAARRPVKDEKKLLAQALNSPIPAADIPLRVGTFNMADDDPGKVRVLVVGEVGRELASDGRGLVGVLFTDDNGKTTGDVGELMTLPRTRSGALSLMLTTALAPGAYTMKLAVALEGQVGSVEHHLFAGVTHPPSPHESPAASALQLGELLVTAPAAGERVVPALDGRVSGDRVVSFVQVALGQPAGGQFSFVFDIVKEESGVALLSAVGEVDGKAKGRARLAEATLDARLLPPGDYGIRLNIVEAGVTVASLFTPFRLERPRATPVAGSATGPAGGNRRAAPARPVNPAPFAREDALDPMVLAPFLEEVAQLSPAASRPALLLAGSGRIDEGVRLLEPGQPGDPALPFLRGLALFEKGEFQPASNEFRAAIAEAPELLVGAFYLGACYAAGGRDDQAIGAWQTSLAALGRYPAVYRFLGDALIRTGQADRASQLLADAAARWPGEEAFRARMVGAAVEAGRYEQALDHADDLIAGEPDDSSVLFLAMRSAFQALLEGAHIDAGLLLERMERYRGLYVAAGGLQQPLVEEWVSYARSKQRP